MPYLLPSGAGLKGQICRQIHNKAAPYYDDLVRLHGRAHLESFRIALEHSGTASVDAFLEHRPDFIEVGKACIASLLLPGENQAMPQMFGSEQSRRHWYEELLRRLNAPFNDFGQNKLVVVTFNYDRSLEHFLMTALQNGHNKTPEECAEQLCSIPILHVYGQLGTYPQLGEPDTTVTFGAAPVGAALERAAAGIRVIHERMPSTPAIDQAVFALRDCKRICFLGFGYDLTNIDRLGLRHVCPGKKVSGSIFGMLEGQRARASGILGVDLSSAKPEDDCLDYLNRFRPLDD